MLVAQPASVQAVALVPASTTSHHLQLSPFTHLQMGTTSGLRLVPANTALTTTGLTLPVGSPAAYYVPQQGAGPGSAPIVAPHTGVTQGLTAGPGGVTDYDYQTLATGLGGSFLNVQTFEKFLGDELDKLLNQNGNLNQSQLTTLLLDVAKGYLTSKGFGFLLDPAVDAIIKRLIGKVFQDRNSAQGGSSGSSPIPAPNGSKPTTDPGTVVVPSGGFTYIISGQIVFTPANGQTSKPGSGGGNGGGNSGDPGAAGPMPTDLTPAETGLSPPAPPGQ